MGLEGARRSDGDSGAAAGGEEERSSGTRWRGVAPARSGGGGEATEGGGARRPAGGDGRPAGRGGASAGGDGEAAGLAREAEGAGEAANGLEGPRRAWRAGGAGAADAERLRGSGGFVRQRRRARRKSQPPVLDWIWPGRELDGAARRSSGRRRPATGRRGGVGVGEGVRRSPAEPWARAAAVVGVRQAEDGGGAGRRGAAAPSTMAVEAGRRPASAWRKKEAGPAGEETGSGGLPRALRAGGAGLPGVPRGTLRVGEGGGRVTLQGLVLLDKVLELLLHLTNSGLLFLALGALRGRLAFDFG
nr:PE-PGRS family protein PE_PGRS16-like [Aegilops tauschii subsp. strangulata]